MNNKLIDKQTELKQWIKKIFKSQKYFAEQYYIEIYVNYDEIDLKQFFERLKKEINRNTTNIEIIEKYLKFIFDSEEFKNSEFIKPNFYFEDNFSNKFNKRMKEISKNITDNINNKEEIN